MYGAPRNVTYGNATIEIKKENMKEYIISACTEAADTNSRREWEYISTNETFHRARQGAIRLSKLKTWHETEILGIDEGEIIHHSFWRNGSLHSDMQP